MRQGGENLCKPGGKNLLREEMHLGLSRRARKLI
jgi:hypothetical protein